MRRMHTHSNRAYSCIAVQMLPSRTAGMVSGRHSCQESLILCQCAYDSQGFEAETFSPVLSCRVILVRFGWFRKGHDVLYQLA